MNKPTLLLAVLCFGASLTPAPSALASDAGYLQRVDFKDLPGVKPESRGVPVDDVVCTSAVEEDEDPFPSSRPFARSKVIYSCTRGDTTFESDRAPYPAERRHRGLNW